MKLEHVLQRSGSAAETVAPDATVTDLLAKLAEFNIGALVVSEDGATVVGIVSERDIVRQLATSGADTLAMPVSAIMTPTVTCAPPTATTADLMGLMTESRVRHVPVLDDEEHMIGIVSIGDVVKSRLGELQDERDALVEYVNVGR
ncbi:MAG: CBS domain-containing protein [Candidatus Nanopelagicales bacterium]